MYIYVNVIRCLLWNGVLPLAVFSNIFPWRQLNRAVNSQINIWPPSAHFGFLNWDFTLNRDFAMSNSFFCRKILYLKSRRFVKLRFVKSRLYCIDIKYESLFSCNKQVSPSYPVLLHVFPFRGCPRVLTAKNGEEKPSFDHFRWEKTIAL